jgi:hypothetical protein
LHREPVLLLNFDVVGTEPAELIPSTYATHEGILVIVVAV